MNTTRLFRMAPLALVMLLLAGPLFFSCSNEIDPWGTEDDSELMTISVNQAGTRTSNDGNSTLWSEGDAISVIHSTTGGNTFWSSWFGFYGGNMFQGSVSRLSSSNDWYAVYPYVEENIAANEINLTFPSRQVQTGNSNKSHFSGEQFPMFGKKTEVARADELSLSMKNLLSAAEFKVTNTEDYPIVVKEIELTGPSYIAGGFKVDLTSDEPVLTAKSGSKTIRLVVTDGEAVASGENALFYMAVAPFDIPAGGSFEIKVVAENTSNPGTNIVYYHTYELTGGTSFSSGSIKTVNVNFDDDSSQNPDAGTAGEVELEIGEQPEDGDYLLVYKNGETSMAFAAFDEYKSQKYAIPVTVVDNQVLPQEDIDLSRFAITIEKAGIEHPNDAGHDAYNVKNSDEKFIFYASGGSGDAILRIQDTNTLTNSSTGNTVAYYHTFVQAADGVQILSSGSESGYNQYLLAYSATNGFYYEQENNGQKLHLFLLGGSAKEHQELTFSAENVTYNFDTYGEGPLTNAPTLSGDMTPVTWSSNNVSVATVDNSGHVTIHGVGIAVITAKAEADQTYYSGSASYTIEVTSSSTQTWYKADEIEDDKQYLIVSNGYALQNNNGSVAATAVTVTNETITLNAPSGLLWTANSSNQLTNNSQYLGSSSSSSGYYSSASLAIGSNAASWTYNAESNLLTCNVTSSSMWGGSTTTTYYLYYSNSSNAFTINSSSSDTHIAALYSTTKPADKQVLSFENSTVRWVLGEDGNIGSTFAVQSVTGNKTSVTYTSSNTDVATISGTTITVKGKGSTTITASAAAGTVGGIEYKAGSASYTLRIADQAPAGFTDLGTFNLENAALTAFLDDASVRYPADDQNTITNNTYASTSVISTYANWSSPSRKDIPSPVELSWDVASTGTATVTVYSDQALTDEVWTWTASTGSKSFDVYNLIPGLTYYCTVVDDNNGNYLLKGTFNTEGRRRMIKVSDTVDAGHANNCRDLGGLKTTDGRRIKYGLIFRGTNMTSTTTAEKKIIAEFMNVGLDNDLRSGSGGGMNRDNPFESTSYSVRYVGPGYSGTSDLQNVSKYKQTIQAFLDAAKPGTENYNKASYFHCYIGADRTGYTGLIIEGLLGVSLTDCTIDYELTTFSTAAGSRPRNSSSMCYINDAVKFLNQTDNGGTGTSLQEKITYYFINKLGISETDIENFKAWALEPDPEAN